MKIYDFDSFKIKDDRKKANAAIHSIKEAMAFSSPIHYNQLKTSLDTKTVFQNEKRVKMFLLLLEQQYGKQVKLNSSNFFTTYPTVETLVNALVRRILNKPDKNST